jgi:prepilin-type N-terminal cleavage/methylation domain-containing protein
MMMQSPRNIILGITQSGGSMKRRAFTLIELLVVITIILTLTAVTIASFNYSIGADRVRSAARQFQSFVAGARDKAIFANEVRGVRLLLDPTDNHAVSGMQYIGAPQRETGFLSFNPIPNTPTTNPNYPKPYDASGKTVFYSVGSGTPWSSLKRRGFLQVGARIQLPAATGAWYTVSAVGLPYSGTEPAITLSQPNLEYVNSSTSVAYNLELFPGILGDAQPVLFPRGVVIDLDGSQLPSTWQAATLQYPVINSGSSYPVQMDILFTPRGTVVGGAMGQGLLHFHFADAFDVAKWHVNSTLTGRNTATYSPASLPLVPADASGATPPFIVQRDRILATLSARTGNVSVHYVNTTGAASGFATDPFKFAETGQVANK